MDGHVFDCSDLRQADMFNTTKKCLAEYVGATFKHGGDIRAYIEQGKMVDILLPEDPAKKYKAGDAVPRVEQIRFKKSIDATVKRQVTLDENNKRAYSVALGQCTELLKSKLHSSKNWERISANQDVLQLLDEIKSIVFRFEEQKFIPLAGHQAKSIFYSFCQNNLSNADYFEKFRNHVDIASSYDGELEDSAIVEWAS